MAGRVDAFEVALTSLRERLREGVWSPGRRVTVSDTAAALRLSATPVREALSRLAGEGLLEDRRGEGFFVRPLSASDIADLFRLSEMQLLMSPKDQTVEPGIAQRILARDADPIRTVEALFEASLAGASRAWRVAYRNVQVQLGPVRRREPRLLPDLVPEAEEIAAASGTNLWPAVVGAFHARRIALAGSFADLLSREG